MAGRDRRPEHAMTRKLQLPRTACTDATEQQSRGNCLVSATMRGVRMRVKTLALRIVTLRFCFGMGCWQNKKGGSPTRRLILVSVGH
jgi:hypothetical protein